MATKKKQAKKINVGLFSLALARISLGFVFVWAFVDKLIGLGFATCRDQAGNVSTMCSKAWLSGGSPTSGFLQHGTQGPLADFYQSLAGHSAIDWLFMMGILLIGVALIFGIGVRLAAIFGSLLLLMMWSAALWPANNPLLDEHIIYIFVLFAVLGFNDQQQLGAGKWWAAQPLVQKYPVLK